MLPLSLLDENGKAVELAVPQGKWLVIYFYPKDDTSGCTAQAKEFSALLDDYKAESAMVYGVNTDSPESHRKFREKYGFTVSLLSDPEGKVAKSFKVNIQNGMCSRDSVLVNPQGKIEKIYRGVDPKGNPNEILKYIRERK